jgi:hypothetical protein
VTETKLSDHIILCKFKHSKDNIYVIRIDAGKNVLAKLKTTTDMPHREHKVKPKFQSPVLGENEFLITVPVEWFGKNKGD